MMLLFRPSDLTYSTTKKFNIPAGISVGIADQDTEPVILTGTSDTGDREAKLIGDLTSGFKFRHGLILEDDPCSTTANLAFIFAMFGDHCRSDEPEHVRKRFNLGHGHFPLLDFAIFAVCYCHLILLSIGYKYCIAYCTINKGLSGRILCSFCEDRGADA